MCWKEKVHDEDGSQLHWWQRWSWLTRLWLQRKCHNLKTLAWVYNCTLFTEWAKFIDNHHQPTGSPNSCLIFFRTLPLPKKWLTIRVQYCIVPNWQLYRRKNAPISYSNVLQWDKLGWLSIEKSNTGKFPWIQPSATTPIHPHSNARKPPHCCTMLHPHHFCSLLLVIKEILQPIMKVKGS